MIHQTYAHFNSEHLALTPYSLTYTTHQKKTSRAIRSMLHNYRKPWWAHNTHFDYGWLKVADLLPAGPPYCTMTAARILNMGLDQKVSLKAVCEKIPQAGY